MERSERIIRLTYVWGLSGERAHQFIMALECWPLQQQVERRRGCSSTGWTTAQQAARFFAL